MVHSFVEFVCIGEGFALKFCVFSLCVHWRGVKGGRGGEEERLYLQLETRERETGSKTD